MTDTTQPSVFRASDGAEYPHDHSGFAEFGCQGCEAAADEQRQAAIDLLTEQGLVIIHPDVLTRAKIGLLGALAHPFDSCNVGDAEACFVCEGLFAVGKARNERWTRRPERASR